MTSLFDTLVPETRTMVYGYVLTFETPLKHITEMRPFVKKLTGVERTSEFRDTGSEIETAKDIRRVNTSILTANKLIYLEAIVVFYKHNMIHFDAQMFQFKDLVSPRATDLSLAKHVIVKIDDSVDPKASRKIRSAVKMSDTTIPAIFPSMRTCSVYVSVDTDSDPSTLLVSLCCSLRGNDMFNEAYFNGVGSVHAVMRDTPCLELVMQSRWTMDRWANLESVPLGSLTIETVSATSLHQASRAHRQNIFGQYAKFVFCIFKTVLEEPEL